MNVSIKEKMIFFKGKQILMDGQSCEIKVVLFSNAEEELIFFVENEDKELFIIPEEKITLFPESETYVMYNAKVD